MSQWTPEKPGEGDTETLVTIAATLDLIAEASLQRGQITTTAVNLQPGFWTGAAANTWNSALSPALPRATTLASSLTSAANALRAYHDEVADIKLSAELNQKEAEAEVSNASHEGVRCYIRPTYGGTRCMANRTTLISAWDDDFERKEERALDYTGRLRRLDTALEMLATRRTTADSTLKNALNAAMGSDWSERYALFTSVGITDPGQMTGERLAEEFAVYLEGAVTGFTSGLSEEELTRIEEFYRLYGTNESVLSVMYENLGGDGLRTVMQRLEERATAGNDSGEFIETTLLPIAGQIRDGLALGSQNWSEKVSQNFADHLFGVEKGSTSYGQVSAFLFDGLKPFGPNLALALANSLDKSERILGRPVMDGTAEATDISRHSALLSRDRALTGRDTSFPIDVASGVFTQLSHHPDQAVSFFRDGFAALDSQIPARVEYWLGDRQWKDGYVAPLAVTFALSSVDGGPYSDAPDLETSRLVAALTAMSLTGLGWNPEFKDSHVSDDARNTLALILSLYAEGFAQGLDSDAQESSPTDWLWYKKFTDLEGKAAYSPGLSEQNYMLLLSIAQGSLEGTIIVDAGFETLNARYQYQVATASRSDLDTLANGLMHFRGLIDGSRNAQRLRSALVSDQNFNAARDGALSFLSSVPVPVGGPVVGAGITALQLGIGAVADSDTLRQNTYVDALADGSLERHSQGAAQTKLFELLLASGMEPRYTQRPSESIDDWAQRNLSADVSEPGTLSGAETATAYLNGGDSTKRNVDALKREWEQGFKAYALFVDQRYLVRERSTDE